MYSYFVVKHEQEDAGEVNFFQMLLGAFRPEQLKIKGMLEYDPHDGVHPLRYGDITSSSRSSRRRLMKANYHLRKSHTHIYKHAHKHIGRSSNNACCVLRPPRVYPTHIQDAFTSSSQPPPTLLGKRVALCALVSHGGKIEEDLLIIWPRGIPDEMLHDDLNNTN
jgi:hypothetical protein